MRLTVLTDNTTRSVWHFATQQSQTLKNIARGRTHLFLPRVVCFSVSLLLLFWKTVGGYALQIRAGFNRFYLG